MKGAAHEAAWYQCKEVVLQKVGWMMSGMCTFGWMVGWKGAMPKSLHHRGLERSQQKGKKEWSGGAHARMSCRHTISQWGGGGMHKVSGGVHLNVGVPTGLVRMELSSWSMVAG